MPSAHSKKTEKNRKILWRWLKSQVSGLQFLVTTFFWEHLFFMKRSRTISVSTEPATQSSQLTSVSARSKKYSKKRVVPYKFSFSRVYGFPKQLVFKHRYVSVATVSVSSGVPGTLQLYANAMYSQLAGGHQPSYFDYLTAIYNHYTVVKAKLTVRICTRTSDANVMQGTLFINDDSSGTTAIVANECSSGKNFQIPPGGNQSVTQTIYWDAVSTFGPNPLANDNLQGSSSSNPTELSVLQLQLGIDDGISSQSARVFYELEQIAVWDELKDLVAS